MKLALANSLCGSLAVAAVWSFASATAWPQPAPQPRPVAAAQTPEAVAYSSVNQLNDMLAQVDQASKASISDLNRLRVDHWKTDATHKRQMQSNIESIQRNLQSALPEILNKLRAAPEDLNQTFQLYRNLDALYDVFNSVVESAGAFGGKEEFRSLSADLDQLETARRALAKRMDALTTAKDTELAQLRSKVKELSAAATPPEPVTKKVVDDTQEPPKPTKKKTTKKKPATPPTTPTTPPSTQPPQ